MNSFLRLTTPDNRALSIPAGSIYMIESMKQGANKAFPKARCFIYYDIGKGKRTALVVNEFRSVTERMTKLAPRPWVRAALPGNDDVWVAPERILHMLETTEEERAANEHIGRTNIDVRLDQDEIGGISVNDPVEDLMDAIEGKTAREATAADEEQTPAARRAGPQPRKGVKAAAKAEVEDPKKSAPARRGKKSEPPAGSDDEL